MQEILRLKIRNSPDDMFRLKSVKSMNVNKLFDTRKAARRKEVKNDASARTSMPGGIVLNLFSASCDLDL